MGAAPSPLAAVFVTVAGLCLAFGASRWVGAYAGAWRLPPFGAGAVTLGLGLAGFLVPCAIVGRFAGSFDAGLAAAAAAGVTLVVTGYLRPFRRRAAEDPSAEGRATRETGPRLSTRVWFVVLQLGVLALYGYVSWSYQMHDEHAVFGHKSMVEQLRRNEYPPYFPPLPGEEARYHYGYDVLAGALARAYGFSSDVAIDLTCLLLVAFMGWAAAAVVADEDAEGSVPLGVLAVHFGAGLAFVLLAGVAGRHPRCMTQYHHPTCQVELFPCQFLNVFQHPVAVGVPMFLVFVVLAPRVAGLATRWMQATAKRPSARAETLDRPTGLALAGVAVLVLGGLAIGQFVYFALGALAALAALIVAPGRSRADADGTGGAGETEPARRRSAWIRGALALVGVCALGLGLAYAEGGMLAPNPNIDPNLVGLRAVPGFPENEPVTGIAWHHAVNLGLGFVLLPAFVAVSLGRRRPQVALLTAFAIGGIAVAHLFTYVRSWDIVKFPSAASFALSLLYVAVVDDRLRRWSQAAAAAGGEALRWTRRFGAVLLMGTGLTAATFVTFPLDGALRLYDVGQWRGDPLVRETIRWWRAHDYDSADVIYAQSNIAKELSVFGGLSVVAQDADLYYTGVKLELLNEQRIWAARLKISLDPAAIEALGVGWLMFSDEELLNLGYPARRRLENPPEWLQVAATFEGSDPAKRRRIWRVEPKRL